MTDEFLRNLRPGDLAIVVQLSAGTMADAATATELMQSASGTWVVRKSHVVHIAMMIAIHSNRIVGAWVVESGRSASTQSPAGRKQNLVDFTLRALPELEVLVGQRSPIPPQRNPVGYVSAETILDFSVDGLPAVVPSRETARVSGAGLGEVGGSGALAATVSGVSLWVSGGTAHLLLPAGMKLSVEVDQPAREVGLVARIPAAGGSG